jgi:hypothetical protein
MSFFNKIEIDLRTIVFSGLFLFFFIIVNYALIVYQQFLISQVIITSIIFLLLFLALIIIFERKNFYYGINLKFNFYNLILSFFLSIVLLIFFFNENSWLSYYYSTYPLIEIDLGLFWHEDTAFHTSLIQSIINFGYPSIGQHDVPITTYHILSHYIDSLILIISGTEPYDSYGLLFHFKKWIIITSIVIFIARLFIDKSTFIFFIILILFLPLFLYSWHLIGSHGLWGTTLLLLFALPNIFNIMQKSDINIINYFTLFILIVLISLGKVSTGFFLGTLVGFYLLLKNYKDYKIYVFGVSLVIFFIFMKYLFSHLSAEKIEDVYMPFIYNGVWSFLMDSNAGYFKTLVPIYIFIVLTVIIFLILRKNIFKLLFLSSIFTLLVLLFIIKVGVFSTNNIFYFVYGIYSILLLFIITAFSYELSRESSQNNRWILYSLVIIVFVILNTLIRANNINSEIKLKSLEYNINTKVFEKINRWLPATKDNYLVNISNNEFKVNFPKRENGMNLKLFRIKLFEYMKKENLTKQNTLLYIPKRVYKNEITEKEWAKGMLVYAVLGVPLIHGLELIKPEYGFANYTKDALRKDILEIDKNQMCKNKKTILIINSFKRQEFDRLCH